MYSDLLHWGTFLQLRKKEKKKKKKKEQKKFSGGEKNRN